MLHMLMRDPEQCFGAYLFRHSTDENGEYFEYKYENNDSRSSRVSVGRNLMTQDGVTRVRTNWDISFFPGSYVLLADSNMYIIEEATNEISSTASQALLVNVLPDRDTILSLRLVRNPRGAAL